MQEIDARITVRSLTESGRNQAYEKQVITIEINDAASRVCFCTLTMTADQFCEAFLSNLAGSPAACTVNRLDLVGKQLTTETWSMEIPQDLYNDRRPRQSEIVQLLKDHCPDGHEVSTFLGAQGSFYKDPDGRCFVNTHIKRWETAPSEHNQGDT